MDWTRLPLSRASVARAAHHRDQDHLEAAWRAADTRVLLVAGGLLATVTDRGGIRLAMIEPGALRGLGPVEDGPVADGQPADGQPADGQPADGREIVAGYPGSAPDRLLLHLGEGPDGAVHLGLVVPDVQTLGAAGLDLAGHEPVALDPGWDGERTDHGPRWSNLRDVGHLLSDRDAGLAATAVGLAAWHERHPRCALCGAPTVPALAGWTRRCTRDGSDHYPRTDPAVIMAVLDDDDRLLLGHAAHWPERRFSTLAGYVEPGESVEAAVRREVGEEVGVAVGDVDYRGSQPWPFPASLMLAFVARATTTTLVPDGVEVTEARWFTRVELAADVASGRVLLPMRTSVARVLIEEWFGGPLGGAPVPPS